MALGWVVLGEPITGATVLAGLLVLVSVVLLVGLPEWRPRQQIPSHVGLPVPARYEFSRLSA